MNYKVKRYHNRFRPMTLKLVFSTVITKAVCFDFSCRYDLRTDDQLDINKLFGVGYIHHHRHSARFGWRWNIKKQVFEIFGYVYDHGKRISEYICDVRPGIWNEYTILITDTAYAFVVKNSQTLKSFDRTILVKKHFNLIGYGLGPFFGGNLPAPNDMIILMK